MLFPSFVLLFRQLLLSPFSLPPFSYLIRVFSFTEFLSLFGSLRDGKDRMSFLLPSFRRTCFLLRVFGMWLSSSFLFLSPCLSLFRSMMRFVFINWRYPVCIKRDGWIDRYFRLSSIVEILCERKDGKLIVNAINHLLPSSLSLSFSLNLSHTCTHSSHVSIFHFSFSFFLLFLPLTLPHFFFSSRPLVFALCSLTRISRISCGS